MNDSDLPILSLDVALSQAIVHHQAGRLQEAERLYRAMLHTWPDQPAANHNLGVIACQLGQYMAGLSYLKTALSLEPSNALYVLSVAEALLANRQEQEALLVLQNATQQGFESAALQNLRQRVVVSIQNRGDNAVLTSFDMNRLAELFQSGRFLEMEDAAQAIVKRYPNSGFAWKALGASLLAQNKDALYVLQRATELLPGDADSFSNLGNVWLDQGHLADAETSYRQALAIKPDFAMAHYGLGNTLLALNKFSDAAASFRQVLRFNPEYAEAHNSLGVAVLGLGQTEEAVASYRRALALKPGYAEAHNNLGNVLKDLWHFIDAMESYRQAIELKPDFAEAHRNLGNTLLELDRLDEAVKSYRRAIEIKPDFVMGLDALARGLVRQGNLIEAETCYGKSLELKPNNAVRVKRDLMLPPIMGTRAQMEESRFQFEMKLDRLIEDDVKLVDPRDNEGTNFYLAFHGLNDREIQQKIARFYERSCPDLLYVAPHCAGSSRQISLHRKKRLGFLSKFIFNHSISRCFSRVVEEISRETDFDVMLISQCRVPNEEVISSAYPGFRGTHVHLSDKLNDAREAVAALELDILVFLDIGMEQLSYFLAFSRLAHVQCVTAGHPVTTGIRNIDFFLSSDLAETDEADKHYSEKLVRLPVSLFYFERPVLPATFKSRVELGLPEDGKIYLCPMMLQKMHPDFDEAIARILQLDVKGYVVLFRDPYGASWHELLKNRFAQTIPAPARERVIFLPWIRNYADFISMNAASDVVLDPFHFGIGSTAIATFSVGTPIVTKPSEYLRGRVGLFYCKLLDIPECIALDVEDYAQKAVAIAADSAMRDGIRNKILANSQNLFENLQPIKDIKRFILSLAI